MVMRKDYSMDEYKKFLSQPTAYNFGISKDKMAGYFVTHADRLVNRFGLTKAYVKDKLIPRIEDNLGKGSYVIFLSKAIIEGGTQGNFLNHYMRGAPQDKANPLLAVDEDCKVIKTHWNLDSGAPISMDDPLTGSVKTPETGDPMKFYKSLPKKSIGSHYMVMTAAGNWWIFAPNQTANSSDAYYGNAYDDAINIIKHLGGDPFKKGSSQGSGDDSDSSSGSDLLDGLGAQAQKLLRRLFDEIEDMLTYDLHSIGTDMFFSNQYFKLFKTYNNTYRIQINVPFFDKIEELVGSLDFGSDDDNGSDGSDGSNGSNGKYNGKYITSHGLNFRYGKTVAETQANGYPFAGKAHHGNDYDFRYEELKSPISGTVDGNNGHGFTVGDGGIGYDGDGTGWGNRIVIKLDDGSGRSMLFAHLSKINVKAGDKVKVGQVIGVTGNSGEQTTGAHLHVELVDPKHSNRASDRTIDPTPFLEKYS